MRQATSARTTLRGTLRIAVVGLVVGVAAFIGTYVDQQRSSSASSVSEARSPDAPRAVPRSAPASAPSSAPSLGDVPRGDHDGATTDDDGAIAEDDGALPDGVTVFDDDYPGVANLDHDLLEALREAATDAADDGIDIFVNSGWRSSVYQDQLFREAISRYGSEEHAARWVATADTSPHVSGDAVDIGPFSAVAWLSEHGAAYGLCQIYRNELWHYELRPGAIDRGCPSMYTDPAHDPRMQ